MEVSLVKCFENIARKYELQKAVCVGSKSLDYKSLNLKANQIAFEILSKEHSLEQENVTLLFEHGIDMIAGILGTLKAGGTYVPLDPNYPVERLEYIIKDSEARLIITNNKNQSMARSLANQELMVINIDEIDKGQDTRNPEVHIDINKDAYILYTSGSTGKPKGVTQSHKNVLKHVESFIDYMQVDKDDKITLFSSYSHSIAAVDIFAALLSGATLFPYDLKSNGNLNRLVELIETEKISILHAVPSAFRALTDVLKTDEKILSSIRLVILGGEPVTKKDFELYKKYLSDNCFFINFLGATEVPVATFNILDKDSIVKRDNIPIGEAIDPIELLLLDENSQPVKVFKVGEIVYRSEYLSPGYWRLPEKTEEVFGTDSKIGEGRIYRSGDLGRLLPDGNIEYVGRKDFQIKIRGYRVEAGEIESLLIKNKDIKEAVVISKEDKDGNNLLCAYIVTDGEADVIRYREQLKKELPSYMVPEYIVALESLPRTLTGKLDRKALPEPNGGVAIGVIYEAPTNEVEEKLVELWGELLKVEEIGINHNFFDLGGQSIKAMTLVSKIFKIFNVEIQLADVFNHPTIYELASLVNMAKQGAYSAIEPVEKKSYYELSSSQKRIYMAANLADLGTSYNEPVTLQIEGQLDGEKVEVIFKQLVSRHEILRTSFELIEGEPVQVVNDTVDFEIEYFEGKEENITQTINEFVRPFDLKKAPLFRVGIVKLCSEKSILIIDMHHIITDGTSVSILLEEFRALYNGQKLPELRIQYKDFTAWQKKFLKSDILKEQEKFWINYLGSETPVLNLPTDFQRPSVQSVEGSSINIEIDETMTKELYNVTSKSQGTIYMTLLAAFNVLLSKYSGQEDIIIGSPIAGRRHMDLDNVMGVFVNYLAMRNKPESNKSFKEFLKEVKVNALNAYKNQDCQFEVLVEKLNITRDASRNPLYDVIFSLLENESTDIDFGGIKVNPFKNESSVSKVDINLSAIKRGNKFDLKFEYSTKLFKKDTIERLANHYINILGQIINSIDIKISEINLLTEKEKHQLLYEFNETEFEVPEKTLGELFEEQVSIDPNRVAIISKGKTVTYGELNKKANKLSRLLIEKGVKSGSIVGLMIERSSDLFVGILAVLKAGGAYLPIDTEYPTARIEYMLEDSGTCILLTKKGLKKDICFEGEVIEVDNEDIHKYNPSNPNYVVKPSSLAYIIYTSGSTGKPKGVMIEHKSVVNFIRGMESKVGFKSGKSILCLISISFDMCIPEVLLPLAIGMKIVLADEMEQKDLRLQKKLITENEIDLLQITPSRLQVLLEDNNNSVCLEKLPEIMIGAESLPKMLLERVKGVTNARIYNMYGPTESTVWSSVKDITNEDDITLGAPIFNTYFYVLDKDKNLLPVGIPGELYIGGDGLARGYLNRPDLTKEKFIENPFRKGERVYRTGDLVRWLANGELEFLGRIDHQVKIRGYRIELGEIESRLKAHKSIKEAVVIAKEDERANKYLCAYLVSEREMQVADLRDYLGKDLPEYMIPTYFAFLDKMPLNSNGKLDIKSLPNPKDIVSIGTDYEEPRNEIEGKLVEILQEILRIDRIGVNDAFFELGLHSILMMQLAANINRDMQVEVSLRDFTENNTVSKLAQLISKKDTNVSSIIFPEIIPDKDNLHEKFPLTEVQTAYLIGRDTDFEGGGVATHIYWEVETKLDLERLNNALNMVIKRHPMLRAIVLPEGKQRILKEVPEYKIKVSDIRQLEYKEQQAFIAGERDTMSHAVCKSDQWPLFDIRAIKVTDEKSYLQMGFDMLITDAGSFQIFMNEWAEYYYKPEIILPQLDFSFRDYVLAYYDFKKTDTYLRDKKYWLDRLEEFPSAPTVPLKQDPANIGTPKFSRQMKVFDIHQWETLKKRAQENQITPTAVICTAYAEVLAFWSNQPRLALNTTVFNRYPFHKEVNSIVGDFTSTLLLDIDLKQEKSFWDKARDVQNVFMEALEHRSYDGIEFIRDIIKHKNYGMNKAAMPIVITSMLSLGGEDEGGLRRLGDVTGSITQTPQVFIDQQVVGSDEGLAVVWDYVEQLFESEVINGMFEQYVDLLTSLIEANDYEFKPSVADLKLIEAYNFTDEEIIPETLHGMFEDKAKEVPDNIAVIFENREITYRDLDEKSNQVAQYLRAKGIGKNCFVGVLAERCPESIINIMGIIKSGAAYVPVNPEHPEDRRQYILNNSGATIQLEPDSYSILGINKYSKDSAAGERFVEDVAYVIYTSGSTGKPKGVVITHREAANTIKDINNKFEVNEDDRIIGLASMCFDLSVYDIFGALSTGAALVMIRDQRDAEEIAKVLEEQQVTIWNSVPAIMDMLIDSMGEDEERVGDYLNSGHAGKLIECNSDNNLRVVLLSGDWIPINLPDKIKNKFMNAEVISLGGATEGSIWSIYYPVGEVRSDWKSIPYGIPLANQKFYVLNFAGTICPVGVEGELYIGGVGVAEGYMNDSEKTKNAFIEHPKLGRLYKTGDYGVMHQEGYIEFLGRKDFQVKIRGYRVELGEIECSILQHEKIKNAVVIDRSYSNGRKYLCAYVVVKEELDSEELTKYLEKLLPDYMVPSYFVKIEEIPLTANGKVNRSALPEPQEVINSESELAVPTSPLEEKLVMLWKKVLNIEKVNIKDNFFDLGGHSLKAGLLLAEINKEFNATLKLADIFQYPTIKGLSRVIEKVSKSAYATIDRLDKKNYYDLSPAQERMYVLSQLSSNTSYNTPVAFIVEGNLDKGRLENVLRKIINRHEVFRTSFELVNKKVVQRIHNDAMLELECFEAQEDQVPNLITSFIREFDLSKSPLLRVGLIKLGLDKHILIIDTHHIIFDGSSSLILLKEITMLYDGIELPELNVQYKDFAAWQNRYLKSEAIRKQEDYWLETFKGEIPKGNLPTDFPRTSVMNYEGEEYEFELSQEVAGKLLNIAKANEATMFMTLLAAYNVFMGRLTRQEDIIIGVPAAGRNHADLENMIGMFINTLAIRSCPKGDQSFETFLQEVKEVSLKVLENQDYQFEMLLEKINVAREAGRNTLFDTIFNYRNMFNNDEIYEMVSGDLKYKPYFFHRKTTISDITLYAAEIGNKIHFRITYRTSLFTKQTIEYLMGEYLKLLSEIADDPCKRIIEYRVFDKNDIKANKKVIPRLGNISQRAEISREISFFD